MTIQVRILENPTEMASVEELQRKVWPGSETDIVPTHILIAAAHNGGLVIGAFDGQDLVGFVFGFPGFEQNGKKRSLKHCSHMLGVQPEYRDAGVGYLLKRAQWQIVRHQGLEHITWTYDPLESRNAYFNISKLGAVSNHYRREEYGIMRNGLNAGLPSDRLQVDWWVNSPRVKKRLGSRPRRKLDLAHYFQAGAEIFNPSRLADDGFSSPQLPETPFPWKMAEEDLPTLVLIEIPADFQSIKGQAPDLARAWRDHSRGIFEDLFARGYLVTDFLYMPGKQARSFYVFSHGEQTLGG